MLASIESVAREVNCYVLRVGEVVYGRLKVSSSGDCGNWGEKEVISHSFPSHTVQLVSYWFVTIITAPPQIIIVHALIIHSLC